MSVNISNIVDRGTKLAEQAVAQDQSGNYKIAAQAYLAAVEWFMHALKYGNFIPPAKENFRAKVKSYLDRVEEIQKIVKKETDENKNARDNGNKGVDSQKKMRSEKVNNNSANDQHLTDKFEGAIVTNPDVSFDDVIGLEQAKIALKEAVILPSKFPELFQDKRKPWAGILLYGPPGTGKSHLAKAIATECNSTFISVTSADILSKWVGESEQGVKSLFELARDRSPCVIFIDEIDALCGQRSDAGAESSRRVVTEFLTQMQGVGRDNSGVLVLAATNIPWSLDTAMRRRFEKRIYIPLPELHERAAMFKLHLGTKTFHTIADDEWMQFAQKAEDYSGADIATVCREALHRPIRRVSASTHFKQVPGRQGTRSEGKQVWLACSPGDEGAQSMTLSKIRSGELYEPPVTTSDMLAALATQKSTVSKKDLEEYDKFTETFGQDGA